MFGLLQRQEHLETKASQANEQQRFDYSGDGGCQWTMSATCRGTCTADYAAEYNAKHTENHTENLPAGFVTHLAAS